MADFGSLNDEGRNSLAADTLPELDNMEAHSRVHTARRAHFYNTALRGFDGSNYNHHSHTERQPAVLTTDQPSGTANSILDPRWPLLQGIPEDTVRQNHLRAFWNPKSRIRFTGNSKTVHRGTKTANN